jgi:hypothetical protein
MVLHLFSSLDFGTESLTSTGDATKNLGFMFIPISAIAFSVTRVLMYMWKRDLSIDFVKSIWYFSMGMMYVDNDLRVGIIVTSICFIEGIDLFIRHLEMCDLQKKHWLKFWR